MGDECYDKLRSLGVSVETADAIAPILERLPGNKREAFYLWACGESIRNIGSQCGISTGSLYRLVKRIRREANGGRRAEQIDVFLYLE